MARHGYYRFDSVETCNACSSRNESNQELRWRNFINNQSQKHNIFQKLGLPKRASDLDQKFGASMRCYHRDVSPFVFEMLFTRKNQENTTSNGNGQYLPVLYIFVNVKEDFRRKKTDWEEELLTTVEPRLSEVICAT